MNPTPPRTVSLTRNELISKKDPMQPILDSSLSALSQRSRPDQALNNEIRELKVKHNKL
jgi:hypothetical protein